MFMIFHILDNKFDKFQKNELETIIQNEFGFNKNSFFIVDIIFADNSKSRGIKLPDNISSENFEKLIAKFLK